MTAGEDESEQVVAYDLWRFGDRLEVAHRLGFLVGPMRLPSDQVDRAPLRGDSEPAARVAGDAVTRPGLKRANDRILGGVLGQADAAGDADQGRQHASTLLAYEPRDRVTGLHDVRSGSEVDDRPDLDRAVPGPWDPGRPADGLVQVGALQQVEAGQRFLGLGVRSVAGDDVAALAAGHAHRRRGRGGVERIAAPDHGLGCLAELLVVLRHVGNRLWVDLIGGVDQCGVLGHDCSSVVPRRRGSPASTVRTNGESRDRTTAGCGFQEVREVSGSMTAATASTSTSWSV